MKRLLPLTLLAAAQLFAQGSRIELRGHPSAILGLQKNYNIYLPEGYDQDSLRYPVVYLFRGHEREWANPTEDGSRRGNIKTVADALYGRGAIGKMVLVMPGMSDSRTSAEYEYLTKELIPHIDATVRTLPVRQKRGLDGFSYGGVDLLQLVRRNPELFFTAGSYDGSFWALNLTALFDSTTEAYWSLLRSMRFLLLTPPPPGTGRRVSSSFRSSPATASRTPSTRWTLLRIPRTTGRLRTCTWSGLSPSTGSTSRRGPGPSRSAGYRHCRGR